MIRLVSAERDDKRNIDYHTSTQEKAWLLLAARHQFTRPLPSDLDGLLTQFIQALGRQRLALAIPERGGLPGRKGAAIGDRDFWHQAEAGNQANQLACHLAPQKPAADHRHDLT